MMNTKIFLVDDAIFCLSMYKQHLKNLGYEDVTCFTSGSDCLDNLIEYPNIIFLDYKMDNLNGFEVLKKIKRFDPNIFVVMVSGQEDVQVAVDALKFGAFDYITKGKAEIVKMKEVIDRILNVNTALNNPKSSFINKFFPFL